MQVETNWVERDSPKNGAVPPVDFGEWDERLRIIAKQNLQKNTVCQMERWHEIVH